MATSQNHYPQIKDILDLSVIPEKLEAVKKIIEDKLDKVYYKDFIFNKSYRGDVGDLHLSIISYRQLGIEIANTGLELSLNPGIEDQIITEIPIHLHYKWRILKYLNSLTVMDLIQPEDYFNLVLEIIGISSSRLLEIALTEFIDDSDPTNYFITEFNNNYPQSIALSTDHYYKFQEADDLVGQIEANYEVGEVIFTLLISGTDALEKIPEFFKSVLGEFTTEDLVDFVKPEIDASITNIELALFFPEKVLKPVDGNGNIKEGERSKLSISAGSVHFSTEHGLSFNVSGSISFTTSMILNTGISFGFSNAKLDLSRTSNIPEVEAAGYPTDFIGAYINDATIILPAFWQEKSGNNAIIKGRDIIVGTGGFSGTISLDTSNGSIFETDLGGFTITLDAFDLEFRQNEIISSNIHGTLVIDGFEDATGNTAEIGIDVHIGKNGEFEVTASEPDGILLKIPNVLNLYVKSLSIGNDGEDWFLSTTCDLEFAITSGALSGMLPGKINLEDLTIYSDGRFEIKGGKIALPDSLNIKIGPSKFAVTALHLGSHEQNGRKYKYFGFDGGVSVDPGGLDAQGNGIKLYFSVDNDPLDIFLRIESLNIEITLPGDAKADEATLIVVGYLSMKGPSADNPEAGPEFIGGIDFSAPQAGIAGGAGMRLMPKLPAFLIDAYLEFSTPIVLGSTGLGIYGFRGLIGHRYVASREADELQGVIEPDAKWWEYYKAKVAPDYKEGISVSKFKQKDGFSIGAGASIATAPDSGRSFSTKVFLMLSLPEVFIIQGQGAVLSQRIGLDSTQDPPFFALLVVSKNSIELAFGANFMLPLESEKKVAHIDGIIEMGFFFKDASAWYINAGTEERPIKAVMMEIYEAYAFLMLSTTGLYAGAGINYGLQEEFGPAKIDLKAYIDLRLFINRKHFQAGGSLQLGANMIVAIWKVSIGLSANACLAGEAPKPFMVTGTLEACVKVLKEFCFEIDFTWEKEKELNTEPLDIVQEDAEADIEFMKGVNINSKYGYSLNRALTADTDDTIPAPASPDWKEAFGEVALPMDTFIDIEIQKPVAPNMGNDSMQRIGGYTQGAHNVEYLAPKKAYSKQVEHQYRVNNVHIKYWNEGNSAWEDYDPYGAMLHLADLDYINAADLENKKKGFWQLQSPKKYNKLRLLSQSPLSFMNDSPHPDTEFENFGFCGGTLLCEDEIIAHICNDWTAEEEGTVYRSGLSYAIRNLLFKVYGYNGVVETVSNPFDIEPSLVVRGGTSVEMFLPEPSSSVNLKLSTSFDQVVISYYKRVFETEPPYTGRTGLPNMSFELVHQETLNAEDLNSEILYEAADQTVDKVIVTGLGCTAEGGGEGEGGGGEGGEGGESYEPLFNPDYSDYECWLAVHEICYLRRKDYLYNLTIPSEQHITDENQAIIDGFNKTIQPIWRPNTKFAIQIELDDQVDESPNVRYYTYGFSTKGPLGHYHPHDPKYTELENEGREDQYKLSNLKGYIDYERSYPNANGQLIGAKPLYYSNEDNEVKLDLFYKKPYVQSFFADWSDYGTLDPVLISMDTIIKDPAAPEVQSQNKPSEWLKNTALKPEKEVQSYNNLMEYGENCIGNLGEATPFNINSKVALDDLKPMKLYTGIFKSVYEVPGEQEETAEVHRYPFRTSRYKNFAEHINSYILEKDDLGNTTAAAIYEVELDAGADLALADNIVKGQLAAQPDSLLTKYALPYDRLVQGAFLLIGEDALPAAQTTEFNKIYDSSGTLAGVLVRSPEPLNDPKLPTAQRDLTIEVSHNNDVSDYHKLFSKDLSGTFITNEAMDIPAGQLTIDFNYRLYDGEEYVELKSVQVVVEV